MCGCVWCDSEVLSHIVLHGNSGWVENFVIASAAGSVNESAAKRGRNDIHNRYACCFLNEY